MSDGDRQNTDRPEAATSLPPEPTAPGFERAARLAELGVLTASLLHELRQPLFAMKGSLQLSRHRGEPVDVDGVLTHLHHIEELLDHYAGFGRIDEPMAPLDARDPVRRAARMLRHRQKQLGATVAVDLPEALPVVGRAVALQQVAVNLIQNALDAVDGCATRRVEVRGGRAGAVVELTVTDSGPGVPAEVRERLFEPFVTSKPAGRGTGLGLYIARTLVEELGGSLDLADAARRGTEVVVRLPARADA